MYPHGMLALEFFHIYFSLSTLEIVSVILHPYTVSRVLCRDVCETVADSLNVLWRFRGKFAWRVTKVEPIGWVEELPRVYLKLPEHRATVNSRDSATLCVWISTGYMYMYGLPFLVESLVVAHIKLHSLKVPRSH